MKTQFSFASLEARRRWKLKDETQGKFSRRGDDPLKLPFLLCAGFCYRPPMYSQILEEQLLSGLA
ncbi:MAG: hypothetical protein ACR2IV_05700 [Bryobacteraceae bacterium]